MNNFIISKDKLENDNLYKYIRLSNDEIRFTNFMNNHSDLVTEDEKPNVISAGLIGLMENTFIFTDYGSISLGVGWDDVDTEILEKLLSRKEAEKRY